MKKLLFLIILVLGAYLFWWWWTHRAVEVYGEEIFYNRMWADHLPKSDTDTIQIFAAVTEQPVGIFQASSSWKAEMELFRYEPRGDGNLVLMFPQTRSQERVKYRATRCSVRDFDFCLEVSGNSRGAKKYFSQKGWEIGSRTLDGAHALTLPQHPDR